MRQPGLSDLIARWTQRQQEWSKLDVSVKGAALAEEVLADLEAVANATDDELNLSDAANISGYTADHLSRLIRENKLNNYGRKGAPRVRRSELPMRPASLARGNGIAYSVSADVRSLGTRR